MTLDYSVYSSIKGSEGMLFFSRIFNPGDSKIVVDKSYIDKFQIIETFTIPIDLSNNDLGLTNEMVNSAGFQSSKGDLLQFFLSEPMILKQTQ